VTGSQAFEFFVEPLDASHDRSAFYSGVSELDRYLQQQAGQDLRRKAAAPFVLLDASRAVVGYYTLSAYSIQLSELPPALAKKLPRYPRLPATLLGRLAIAESHHGRKLGRYLLMDALHRTGKASVEIASIGVVVDAIDEAAMAFYRHHEFERLPGHASKLFLAMATIEKAFTTPSR
jgi:GNAT superfamily N-acetyltransferase